MPTETLNLTEYSIEIESCLKTLIETLSSFSSGRQILDNRQSQVQINSIKVQLQRLIKIDDIKKETYDRLLQACDRLNYPTTFNITIQYLKNTLEIVLLFNNQLNENSIKLLTSTATNFISSSATTVNPRDES